MHPDPSGLAHSLSPVDLAEPLQPLPHPLRWTSMAIVVAALVLALLNAHAIRGWSYQLAPGPWSERFVAAAETWHDAVDQAGLNRPGAAMRSWWLSVKARRFDAQPSSVAPSRNVRQ